MAGRENVEAAQEWMAEHGGVPLNPIPIAKMTGKPEHCTTFAHAMAKSEFARLGCLEAVAALWPEQVLEQITRDELVTLTAAALHGFMLATATFAKVTQLTEEDTDKFLLALTSAVLSIEQEEDKEA